MRSITTKPALRASVHSLALMAAVSAGLVLASGAAKADVLRSNTVSFSTSSTQELTQDLLLVTMQIVREGAQAADVQASLKQGLESALADARKSAKGAVVGGMDVRTGQFTVQPRYANNGKVSGWQGVAQLILEGTDTARISQAVGQLNQLNVVNVQYGLSRGLREQYESSLTSQAIARFKARAAQMAQEFGFKGYSLGEVSVSSTEPGFEPRPMLMAMRAKSFEAADAALPVEPGKGVLSVTVSGQVVLAP